MTIVVEEDRRATALRPGTGRFAGERPLAVTLPGQVAASVLFAGGALRTSGGALAPKANPGFGRALLVEQVGVTPLANATAPAVSTATLRFFEDQLDRRNPSTGQPSPAPTFVEHGAPPDRLPPRRDSAIAGVLVILFLAALALGAGRSSRKVF